MSTTIWYEVIETTMGGAPIRIAHVYAAALLPAELMARGAAFTLTKSDAQSEYFARQTASEIDGFDHGAVVRTLPLRARSVTKMSRAKIVKYTREEMT